MAATASQPLLETCGLGKSFPGVRALHQVDFRLLPGEIHVVMGQNGAGKSTLIKLLTGVYTPDSGEIKLSGQTIHPTSPEAAQALGISTVYQEVNLCPNLSVAENIFIGRLPRRWGRIDWAEAERLATRELAELNLHIDVSKPLADYPVAVQQMVAIARAMAREAQILILDEPTSSLDAGEVKQLFDAMRCLKEKGVAILFVTHFLDQVYAVADRITVLRNGERVGEYPVAELGRRELVSRMVGRDIAEQSTAAARADLCGQAAGAAFLSARGLGRHGAVRPLDLELRAGEVLGLSGLLGSGRTETARLLFGVDSPDCGELSLAEGGTRFRSPRDAIEAGLGYCPEDRKTEGIIAELTLRENIVLALQAKRGLFRFLSMRRQLALAQHYIELLGIKTPSTEKPIGQLSGGNQQKALLARWLATEPRMLILDEPTRGIDVAAKQEIMQQVLVLCGKGLAILFISSETEEVVRVSHRIAVLRDRAKAGELAGEEIDEQAVLRLIVGAEA
ncbi:sugar ABC transporter ATP-binding protein [Chitinimonas sp.]|uniref:sugar ABC transporter ATP-binding protein n=1 Tax=Chitinimonas sp. TaxID=1934313 RepID=UPI002F954D6C